MLPSVCKPPWVVHQIALYVVQNKRVYEAAMNKVEQGNAIPSIQVFSVQGQNQSTSQGQQLIPALPGCIKSSQ